MKANVGTMDRILRAVAGAALLILGFIGNIAAPWNYVAIGVGAVLLLTAAIRFCPLYPILGMNTCGKKES